MDISFIAAGIAVFAFTFTIALLAMLANRQPILVNYSTLDTLEMCLAKDKERPVLLPVPAGFTEFFLQPSKDFWSIPVLRYGQGTQPILVIPGNNHSAHSYRQLMYVLGKFFDVWAYSPAGTGNSTEDKHYNQSLTTAHKELEIVAWEVYAQTGKRPIAIGHSFGGYLLRTHPQKDGLFSGLVLLSSLEETGFAERKGAAVWNQVLDAFDVLHSKAEKFSRQYYLWIAGGNASALDIAGHAATIRYQFQTKMILESAKRREPPAGSELPTMFVASEDDATITVADVERDYLRVRSKFPYATFAVIPGGHLSFDYEMFANLMRERFLPKESNAPAKGSGDNVVKLR